MLKEAVVKHGSIISNKYFQSRRERFPWKNKSRSSYYCIWIEDDEIIMSWK